MISTPERSDSPRIEAQKIIRAKYGFPPRDMRIHDPLGYIRRLMEINKALGVTVRPFYEYSNHPLSLQAAYDRNTRAIFLPPGDISGSAINLEHETIHACQHRWYPRMPKRMREYEAYLIGWSPKFVYDKNYTNKLAFALRVSIANGNYSSKY